MARRHSCRRHAKLLLLLPSVGLARLVPKGLLPFKNLRGDDAHKEAFDVFDKDESGNVSLAECRRFGIDRRWFVYYDRNGDGVLNITEFMPLFRERKLFSDAALRFNLTLSCEDERCRTTPRQEVPTGHLQPLGTHAEPGEVDVLDSTASPEVFWKEYVHKHRPVLLRGIQNESRAFRLWDEQYLAKEYGWVDLRLEAKIENRGDAFTYSDVEIVDGRMNMSEFVQGEKNMRSHNLYAIAILPQAMAWDVTVPPCLMCGGRRTTRDRHQPEGKRRPHSFPHPQGHNWMTHLYEADLWIGHGNVRSQLHYDKENNMNCLYRGQKDWILIDTRQHHEDVEWVRGSNYVGENDLLNHGTDWVAIDSASVDLVIHSRMANISYQRVTQRPGDCLYLPYSMLHWVNKTDPGFQVAVSYMWLQPDEFDAEACAHAPFPAKLPLATWDILWHYAGRGAIPFGFPDPEIVVKQMKEVMEEDGLTHWTFEALTTWWQKFSRRETDGHTLSDEEKGDFFNDWSRLSSFAAQPELGLALEEMMCPRVPLSDWLQFLADWNYEGTNSYNEGKPWQRRQPEEEERMEQAIQAALLDHKSRAAQQKPEL